MNDQAVEMIISIEKGRVLQQFKEPMREVFYDPQNAIDVACAMTDAAFEARDGLKPAGATLKAELIQRHRDKLVPRIALMLASMREDKLRSDGYLAEQFVSTVLSEVF
jgi:hypothetical protein